MNQRRLFHQLIHDGEVKHDEVVASQLDQPIKDMMLHEPALPTSYPPTSYMWRQREIFLTKYLHGFNHTDVAKDFEYMLGEVDEAREALKEQDKSHFIEELADIVIYCYGIAQIAGHCLDDAIFAKMAYNAVRKYATDLEG